MLHSIEKTVAVGEGPKLAVARAASQRQLMPSLGFKGPASRASSLATKLSGTTTVLDDKLPLTFFIAAVELAATGASEWQPASNPNANETNTDMGERELFIIRPTRSKPAKLRYFKRPSLRVRTSAVPVALRRDASLAEIGAYSVRTAALRRTRSNAARRMSGDQKVKDRVAKGMRAALKETGGKAARQVVSA